MNNWERQLKKKRRHNFGSLLASPEHIFAGNYAILDANIFDAKVNKNFGQSIVAGFSQGAGAVLISSIKQAVSRIYYILRNTCAVALLCLLIYAGIRIVLASNSPQEQSKWKTYLFDWLKGLVLVIFMHLIMIAIFYITDLIKAALNQTLTQNSSIAAICAHNCFAFSGDITERLTALIMFGYVTYLTIVFTIAYFKRLVWTVMLIVIAPVVAVIYPINGSAYSGKEIFNKWLKEFTMNAALPIFHCVIYYVLTILPIQIASSSDNSVVDNKIFSISVTNPFIITYCLFSMSMIRPAERFFRNLFNIRGEVANMGTYDSGKKTMRAIEDVIKKIGMLVAVVATGGAAAAAAPAVAGGAAAAGGATAGGAAAGGAAAGGAEAAAGAGGLDALGEAGGLLGEGTAEEGMLDVYDEGFGTDEWDPFERDNMARSTGRGQGGMNYSDEEMKNMLSEAGYSDEQIQEYLNEGEQEKESDKKEEKREEKNSDKGDTVISLLQDIKTILEDGDIGEQVKEAVGEEGLNDTKLNLDFLDELIGDSDSEDGEKKGKWERLKEGIKAAAGWKEAHPELVDAVSNLIDSYHGVTDTMYTDPPPQDWKNDTWHRGAEDRQKRFEMRVQQHVNNNNNIKWMMDKHNLLEKYRKLNTRSNGSVNEERAMEEAKEKAKQMLKTHEPFLRYGINDLSKLDALSTYQKQNGGDAQSVIKGYANAIRADAQMTAGIRTYMVQNHEQIQATINGTSQNIDMSKFNADKLNAEQMQAINQAVEQIKTAAKQYESAGNSQQRSIELATLERNMQQKEILKNLDKNVSKTDYVEKTYAAINKISKTNENVKLNGSDSSANIKNMEQLLNSEINKKRN